MWAGNTKKKSSTSSQLTVIVQVVHVDDPIRSGAMYRWRSDDSRLACSRMADSAESCGIWKVFAVRSVSGGRIWRDGFAWNEDGVNLGEKKTQTQVGVGFWCSVRAGFDQFTSSCGSKGWFQVSRRYYHRPENDEWMKHGVKKNGSTNKKKLKPEKVYWLWNRNCLWDNKVSCTKGLRCFKVRNIELLL